VIRIALADLVDDLQDALCIAAVADHLIAVVTGLGSFCDSVTAHRLPARLAARRER
jgi:hypothetical protein